MKICRLSILLALLAIEFGARAEVGKSVRDDLQMHAGGIVRGPTGQQKIALTFTGHSFAEGGETILNELARHKARASFFFTGDLLANTNFESLVRRVIADGHYLGPHSDKHLLYCDWDNPNKTLVTRGRFRADLNANLKQIERFGVDRSSVRYFLPPFEQFNRDITRWSAELGLTVVNFTPGTRANADYTGEADRNFVSSQAIFDSIVKRERENPHGLNGFILLLHIGSGPGRADKFANRFGELLDFLAAKGYEFVRVDELLEGREEVFVRANQVGYGVRGPKAAVAFSKSTLPEKFSIVDATSQKVVFTGRAKLMPGTAWGQFTNHAALDFSPLKKTGNYFIRCGRAVSPPFQINPCVLAALPDELLEFMREQRCGYNPWLGTNCHPLDGRTVYGPLANGTPLDVTGGWHDAGDLLKYLLTSGNATAQMLLAYELDSPNPHHESILSDQVNALGNPGTNGIPDVLDEARWGLDWMLKLHPAPDQLYHQVADDRDHAGWRLPQNETGGLRLGQGWRARGVFRRRPAAGFAAIPERVHRRRQSRGPLRGGDGAGVSDLERRSAASGILPSAVCRRARKSMNWAAPRKACNRAIPTARRIATRKRPGPTTWNGARRSCSARPASAAISRRGEALRAASRRTNAGWARSRPGITSITRS